MAWQTVRRGDHKGILVNDSLVIEKTHRPPAVDRRTAGAIAKDRAQARAQTERRRAGPAGRG